MVGPAGWRYRLEGGKGKSKEGEKRAGGRVGPTDCCNVNGPKEIKREEQKGWAEREEELGWAEKEREEERV
jgi:hypothetical protein